LDELQIQPGELKQRLDRGEPLLLVDCREPQEYEIGRLPSAKLVPMAEVPVNLALFASADEVVVYCHHGVRSLNVAAWLRAQGIEGVRSLAGGIERWSLEIDSSVPRY
jgi:adenylyltransferase/sulfurtransferase